MPTQSPKKLLLLQKALMVLGVIALCASWYLLWSGVSMGAVACASAALLFGVSAIFAGANRAGRVLLYLSALTLLVDVVAGKGGA